MVRFKADLRVHSPQLFFGDDVAQRGVRIFVPTLRSFVAHSNP